MTGGGVSWSAPGWVGVSDGKFSELIQRKAVAVTRRDKRRGGKYSVKEAIEAIHEAFHRDVDHLHSVASSSLWSPAHLLLPRRSPELALLLQALK